MAMPVPGLGGGLGFFVDSVRVVRGVGRGRGERAYRTVRASSSIGAPEMTAAGRTSVSSLPFMTLFGIGEKVLRSRGSASEATTVILLPVSPRMHLRGSLIDFGCVIWLIVSNLSILHILLADQTRLRSSGCNL